MESKTQIFTNLILSACFGFSSYLCLETHQKIKQIKSTFDVINLRDQIYHEERMQFLNNLNKAIEQAENKIKSEQDRLNTF